MESFFPSEIARLVLGYLKEEKCSKTWQNFLDESSHLEEYCNLYKKGKVYSTKVNGNSLLDVLKEYCELKSQVINNTDKLKSTEQEYHISESDFLEAIRKDVFLETTKNTIDSVFQKYLSSSVFNGQTSSSHNSSNDILSSKSRNSNFRKKESEISCSVGKTGLSTDECCEKQDQVPDIINGININTNNLNASKTDTELIILEKDSNALKHLEVPTNKNQQNNCTSTDSKLKSSGSTSSFVSGQSSNQDSLVSNPGDSDGCNTNSHIKQKLFTSVKNSSALNSDCTIKENTISLSESSQNDDDDDEILVINEIKKGKLVSIIQPSQSNNFLNDLITNKCPSRSNPVINVENNNATVNQATVCSLQPTITEVCSSKQKEIFSQSNPVNNVELNNSQDGIKQAVVYNVPTEVNPNYNREHVGNSSNIKTNYNISTSSLLNKPTTIDQIQSTSTKYILPNYSSSGSFANNTQYYIVLNTPMNSSVSGTYMTVPGIQTNVSNPVLPSVSTTFVNNSASQVGGVSNPLPAITLAANRTVPASENNLVSAHENIPTKSNVSDPQTMAVTQSTARLPKIMPRGKRRISYKKFLESDTDESLCSVDKERLENPKKKRKLSKMKKFKSKAFIDESDSTEEVDVMTVKELPEIQKTPKKKKTRKKHNKKKGTTVSKVLTNCKAKEKQGTSHIEHESHFEYHPTNISSKNQQGAKKSNKVTDGGISVSSCSDIHNNSQSIVSKTASGNADQSAVLDNNRVLKVVLSDVFQHSNLEPNALCNRYPESNLVQHDKDIEDQVSHSKHSVVRRSPRKHYAEHLSELESSDTGKIQLETNATDIKDQVSHSKHSVQRRSPRKHYAEHLSELESSDTGKIQLVTNATDSFKLPLKIKKKQCQSVSKIESCNSFDMKAAVLSSMEKARHIVTPKKYPASFGTKELNSWNLFKSIAVKPKSTCQTVRDTCENVKCIKTKCNDLENKLVAGNEASHQSCEIKVSHIFSLNKSSKIDQNAVTLSCNNNYKNGASNDVAVYHLSSSEDSCFEIHNRFPEKPFQKDLELNETTKVISLKVNDKNSSDNIDVENETAVGDCTKEKKMLVTNSLSNLHQVNVSTKLETKLKSCVARELNSGDKPPFFSSNSKALDKEEFRHLTSEIFKAESGSFNSVNIGEVNSNFIHCTEETSMFSVLTSVSTNTKVLGLTEMHSVMKPDSDILDVSTLREKMPLTSD